MLYFIVIPMLLIFSHLTFANSFFGEVKEVISGDTIRIFHNSKTSTLRLAHIKCPKSDEFLGKEAASKTAEICLDKTVEVRVHDDVTADEFVGDIILDSGEILSILLLKDGLALLSRTQSAPADFLKALRHAMLHEKGLHARHRKPSDEQRAATEDSDGQSLGNLQNPISIQSDTLTGGGETLLVEKATQGTTLVASDNNSVGAVSKSLLDSEPMQSPSTNSSSKKYIIPFTATKTTRVLTAFFLSIFVGAFLGIIVYVVNRHPQDLPPGKGITPVYANRSLVNKKISSVFKGDKSKWIPVEEISGLEGVVCDRCKQSIQYRETFIGAAKRRDAVVARNTSSEYSYIYDAVVCAACGRVECVHCKGKELQAPCSWCGGHVKPAWPENLSGRKIRLEF